MRWREIFGLFHLFNMADTSITRRLSFGSRSFPIDKYLSGIDDSELLGLHYIAQHNLAFTSQADLTSQEELFTSLKYYYMQNNVMLKMHENVDADFDSVEPVDKLKRVKQAAKEAQKEQQKVDQELKQVISQVIQLQQQYQELQLHLRNSLAPLNQSLEVSQDDKDKERDTKGLKHNTIETQTDESDDNSECRDHEDMEPSLIRGAARMAHQRNLTKQLSGADQVERTNTQGTLQMGRDALSFELDDGRVELSGAYCDATFFHGDVLDYAANANEFPLLCYDLVGRLKCRDAISADVAQIEGATWDDKVNAPSWQVRVPLPNGHSATLVVDPNYGTEFGRVKIAEWSALAMNPTLQKTVDAAHGPVPYTLLQVVRLLANAL